MLTPFYFIPINLIIICCLSLFIYRICLPNNVYAHDMGPDTNGIKFITLNMHDGYDEKGQDDLARTLTLFEREKPDIIFLQEVEPRDLNQFHISTGFDGADAVVGLNYPIILLISVIISRNGGKSEGKENGLFQSFAIIQAWQRNF